MTPLNPAQPAAPWGGSCVLGGPGVIYSHSELHAESQAWAGPPQNHWDPKQECGFPVPGLLPPLRIVFLHEPAPYT